jgi:hypothetical protein
MPRARINTRPGTRRGRPPVLGEAWSKASVVLFDRQIAELDHLLSGIRARRKTALNRAGLIRALIDGFLDGQVDMTSIKSEKELRTRIGRSLRSRS